MTIYCLFSSYFKLFDLRQVEHHVQHVVHHPLLLTTPPITCIAAAFVQARQTQVISTHFTFIIYLQFSAKRCHEASKVVAKGSSEGVLSVEGCHLGFTVTKLCQEWGQSCLLRFWATQHAAARSLCRQV